ncbi:hypothetical protein IQ07DRAFT_509780 [Pyrenochaeta sp. DS3sAY3a]|nr:hypothetical protein IQ07DRAFT_509780 [Pyrenochaeta sp. DS3sAY3a]
MANGRLDNDHDSAFGDDDILGLSETMFSSLAPLAGSKRDADKLKDDDAQSSQPGGPGHEYHSKHIDPRVLCCNHCPEPCPQVSEARPSKRKASAHKVGEFHSLSTDTQPPIDSDCQFPDDCFEKFCQECNLEAACPPDCAVPCSPECTVPCPGDDCAEDEACFDPHCSSTPECADQCIDPECTKLACPDKPCFCQKCDAQPCPLGDPDNQCHFAHSAPTPVGTIYCYDNAPCHFQEGFHGHDNPLASFETYPCFSQNHVFTGAEEDATTLASSVPTPALSHSNYTSLDSAFGEISPAPGHAAFSSCYLNIAAEHCHIDNSCCHGPRRACGDYPSASQQQLDLWNSSMAQGNGLANTFMNFNFNTSHPTSPVSMDRNHMSATPFSVDTPLLGFNDQQWMLTDPVFTDTYQESSMGINKLDFLASAVQSNLLGSHTATSAESTPAINSGSLDTHGSVCKWQHSPGVLCLAVFDSAEALHKHIKTAHVDNCTHCFCQWEGCDASAKDFKQRSKLSRHLLGHAGYRPYACSYEGCDKTFATNQAKDNHERTHTGERPYVCDRCGYTTTTHTQLQTHISALHEGKKPHKCRFCDFTCADSSNLSKHERTHQASKTFSRLSYRTLRPYRCPHPNCTFKPDCRWENLKRHLRRSGHCPQLLVETSEDYKRYREGVRHEIDDWHKRNEDGGVSKAGRRKGRA